MMRFTKYLLMIITCFVWGTGFGQDPVSRNPNNSNASVSLSWINNTSRLRIGGSGEGTQNGLMVQGVGDKTFFHVNNGTARLFNPKNPSASVSLSWINNTSRLRIGGSGEGTQNGLMVQGVGDKTFFHVNNGVARLFNPNNSSASVSLSWINNTSRLRIGGSGEGTQNGLMVQGVGDKTFFYVNNGVAKLFNPNNSSASVSLSWHEDIARLRVGGSGTGTGNGFEIQSVGDKKLFRVSNNGNAAIYGKLEAKEIKISLSPTADFVFEEEYELRKISEVEKFIKENKHLPDFPSGKEIEKNGINVAEMDAKLLQKIEELTLYTIQQQKELSLEKKKNKEQQELILQLVSRMEKLEQE